MRTCKATLLLLGLTLLLTAAVSADAPYRITLSQFHGTSDTHLTSASFGLQGTVTWTGMGQMSSGSYVLSSGFYPAAAIKTQRKVFVPVVFKNNG